jgi:hypothetical protein
VKRRISHFQQVEILHFVQDDRKSSFARGSGGKGSENKEGEGGGVINSIAFIVIRGRDFFPWY